MSRIYVVQPDKKKDDKFNVIEINRGAAVKKFGPYDHWKAIAVRNKYREQEARNIEKEKKDSEFRKAQLVAHKNLPKVQEFSQAEAIAETQKMVDEFKRLNSNTK